MHLLVQFSCRIPCVSVVVTSGSLTVLSRCSKRTCLASLLRAGLVKKIEANVPGRWWAGKGAPHNFLKCGANGCKFWLFVDQHEAN